MRNSLYSQQILGSIRSRGVTETLRYAWGRLVKEDLAPVPLAERLWLNRHGFKPASYFVYGFAGMPRSERSEFITDGANLLMSRRNRRFGAALRNKLLFHRVLALHPDISAPSLVGVVDGDRVVLAAPPHPVVSLEDLFKDDDELLFKPVTGSRGSGIIRMRREDVDHGLLRAHRSDHGYVAVRLVPQASYSAAINPASANTIRVVSMRDPETNKVFIPVAVHRFGVAATGFVDNWSAGGVACSVNVETGVMGHGFRHPRLTGWRVVPLEVHPESGARLLGTNVPNWKDFVATVARLMDMFPDVHFVAWDMLPVKEGWCVIEGNEIMDLDLLQIHGGMLRDQRVARFVSWCVS